MRPSFTDESSMPSAAPRLPKTGLGRAVSTIGTLLALLLLLLGFALASSLVAELSGSSVLRLGVGLGVSLVLPVLFAASRRRRARKAGRRGLGAMTAIGLMNLIILVGALLVAPTASRVALERHGAWWAAAISRAAKKDPQNRFVHATERLMGWVASKIPRSGSRTPQPLSPPPPSREAGPPTGKADAGARLDGGGRDRRRTELLPAGDVRVPFERQDGAMLVAVRLRGSGGEVAAKMIFDTGASLSTLNEATLRRLGVLVAPDDPTVEVRTANGVTRRSLAVVESLALGTAQVGGGLTVALCEPCAQGEVVGLLGLNVSGQFQVTIDQAGGQLVLVAKPGASRIADIRPWVELKEARGSWRGPLLTVDLTVENRAPRAVGNLRIAAVVRSGAQEGRIWGDLRALAAKGRAPARLQGLPAVRGETFQLRLEAAEW